MHACTRVVTFDATSTGPGENYGRLTLSSHFVGLRKVDVVYLAGASRKYNYTGFIHGGPDVRI